MSKNDKSKLELLFEWEKRPFVDKQLDDGVSPNQVAKWCNDNGFEISVPTMYTYAKRRREAIMKGLTLDKLMDKRVDNPQAGKRSKSKAKKPGRPKKNSKKAYANRDNKHIEEWNEERKKENLSVDKLQTDIELLDAVMQKGFETLQKMEAIAPKDFLKAMELKYKFTGGAHNGLTTYGIEEIRLREAARESALTTILLEYIPEDKHGEVLEKMEEATRDFYESIGLGEEYDQLSKMEE